ncbi:MAG: InlB B-repeat-containing protein [Candidatus Izemoplasmatales bacterium]|nr:InlB B-repeat-containing protein [Candidatus Izemoplasmatales bacterium]
MTRKSFWVFFFLFGLMIITVGCGAQSTTFINETTAPITGETTTDSALTLRLKAIYNLAVEQTDFNGTYEEWLETVRGPEGITGEDGREVELQVASGYIQWRYTGSSTWNNLVSLESLRGEDGINGKQVLFRVNSGYIQWQYSDDLTWNNLISVDLLIGESGKEVSFQIDGGYLQYQYEGDLIWTNLIELASLIGPQGLPGQEIELRVNDSFLEWRYSGTEVWYLLYDLMTLKGQDAAFPVITISEDGYWVIDGVVQTQKAYTLEKFTVTFDTLGGEMPLEYPATIEVEKGNSVNLPIPTKEGYLFMGWVTGYTVNDTLFNSYLPVTKNMNLYAEWAVNQELIYDFFEIVNQDHSFNYDLNVDFTNGLNLYYFDIEQYYYFYSSAVIPFDYLESHTAQQLPYMFSITENTIRYTQYDATNDAHVQATSNNGIDWNFNRYPNYEIYDHFLSEVDPSLFVMRPEGLIYDYQGDTSVFHEPFLAVFSPLGLEITNAIIYSEESCVLDLLNKTLTYYAVGANDIPMVGESDFVFSAVFRFNDLDISSATIPFEQMKLAVEGELDNAIELKYQECNMEFVLPDSFSEFENLVVNAQNNIIFATDLLKLADFYLTDLAAIRDFYFEYDEIAMIKMEIINSMNQIHQYYISNATEESIIEMNAVYSQYESAILALTESNINENYQYEIYDDFLEAIDNAYFIDLEKYAFIKYRNTLANSLNYFNSFASETFANSIEREQYFALVYSWQDVLKDQANLTDLQTSYEQAILEITGFTYTVSIPPGYFYFSTDDLTYLLSQSDYLLADPEEYLIYVNSLTEDMYLYTDVNMWVLSALDAIKLSQQFIINSLLPSQTQSLNDFVTELSGLISEADTIALTSELDKLLLLLPECLSVSDYQDLIAAFYENSSKIPFDPWQIAKFEVKEVIEEEYDYLLLTASLTSAGLLAADLEDFYQALALLAIADFAGLASVKENTLALFAIDYESAPEFEILYMTKEEYQTKWEEFYLAGVPYVDLEAQSITVLESLYLYYLHEIRYATDTFLINDYFVNGSWDLILLEYDYLPFTPLMDQLIQELNDYVEAWHLEYDFINSSQVFEYLSYFDEDIYTSPNPYYAYDVYLNYQATVDDYILAEMINYYQNVLYDAYLDYWLIIDDIYQTELEIIYNDYFDMLMYLTVWSEFQETIDGFHAEITLLLPDPWMVAKEEAYDTIYDEFEYLVLTASSTSQDLLNQDWIDFTLALESLSYEDYVGLDLLVTESSLDINTHYETNPIYLEIYQMKLEYLQKWEEYYLIGLPYVDTSVQSAEALEVIYLNYRQSIRIGIIESDFSASYVEGMYQLKTAEYTYLDISGLISDLIILQTDYYDAWILAYPLTYDNTQYLLDNYLEFAYDFYSPYSAYSYYLDYKNMIDEQMIADMVNHYQNILNDLYNDALLVINPNYAMDLDALYMNYWNLIEIETVWANFPIAIDNFNLELDDILWDSAIAEATLLIQEDFGYWMMTASAASQSLLTSDLDYFNLEILEILEQDYISLDTLINDTLLMFEQDYETDPLYLEIFQIKQAFLDKWEEFYLIGLPYVDLEAQPLDLLEDIYFNYRHDIRYSSAEADMEMFYNGGRSNLAWTECQYLPISDFTNNLIFIKTSYVDDWELQYGLSSGLVDYYLQELANSILYASSPYYSYDLYLSYSDLIDQEILTTMEIHYLGILDTAYTDYYNTIDPMYQFDLDMLYFEYTELLGYETVWANFQMIIDNFHIEVAALINP